MIFKLQWVKSSSKQADKSSDWVLLLLLKHGCIIPYFFIIISNSYRSFVASSLILPTNLLIENITWGEIMYKN